MADQDIVRGMIAQLGQSQGQRLAPELDRHDPHLLVPDERSVADRPRHARRISYLHSVFHDANGLFFASLADSADGLGGKLPDDSPSWRPFGGVDLTPAHVGFAVASPVLRLAEGPRGISIDVTLSNPTPDPVSLDT